MEKIINYFIGAFIDTITFFVLLIVAIKMDFILGSNLISIIILLIFLAGIVDILFIGLIIAEFIRDVGFEGQITA